MNAAPCHICGDALAGVAKLGENFAPVSSDGRLAKGQLSFAICSHCHSLQKVVDDAWRRDVAAVYREYSINQQGTGAEPYIFSSQFGKGPRAELLLKFLCSQLKLPAKGKLLDIGCANGNILRAFNALQSEWELYGLENSDKWEKTVRAIPGVKDFYQSEDALKGQRFDVIVMSHVLEHIPGPAGYLNHLKQYLTPQGRIYIAVPNIRQNPIDLLVLDHCTHFDDETLWNVFTRAGFRAGTLRTDVLAKEIIAIAEVTDASSVIPSYSKYAQPFVDMCEGYFALSEGVRTLARKLRAESRLFGIMGTATAAAWLTGEIGGAADFYVDEDPGRIGTKLLNKPVYALADIPEDSTLFIPMAKSTAQKIIARAPKRRVRMEYLDWNEIDLASKLRAA